VRRNNDPRHNRKPHDVERAPRNLDAACAPLAGGSIILNAGQSPSGQNEGAILSAQTWHYPV
jgi:hypothetical protein